MCINGTFWTSEIDFTENLSSRKIMKFPHCAHCNTDYEISLYLPIGPIRGPPCMASIKLVNRSLFFLLTSILGCCNNNLTCKIKKHSYCIVFYVIMGNYAPYHLLSIEWIFKQSMHPFGHCLHIICELDLKLQDKFS